MTLPRVVAPEALDELPPGDPAARRSRRDLRRIHLVMGTRGLLLRALRADPGRGRGAAPLRILELGAGDGTLLLGVARALGPAGLGPVSLTLLDRQAVVEPATLSAFGRAGWQAQVCVADVLSWAASSMAAGTALPGARGLDAGAPDAGAIDAGAIVVSALDPDAIDAAPYDLIVANLFLHHFEGEALDRLLAAVAARGRRFIACEPRRSRLALGASHLVGLLGANAVTRQDAVLSVHAGFRAGELSARWPTAGSDACGRSPADDRHDGSRRGVAGGWALCEKPAGLFSHWFEAVRSRAEEGRRADGGAAASSGDTAQAVGHGRSSGAGREPVGAARGPAAGFGREAVLDAQGSAGTAPAPGRR